MCKKDSGVIWRMRINAAFSFQTARVVLKVVSIPDSALVELAKLFMQRIKCCNCVTQSENGFKRGWCDVREAYSDPVNPSFFLLPLSSVPPTLHFHCSSSHFLPVVCRCSQAANDTFVHHASLLPLPP